MVLFCYLWFYLVFYQTACGFNRLHEYSLMVRFASLKKTS